MKGLFSIDFPPAPQILDLRNRDYYQIDTSVKIEKPEDQKGRSQLLNLLKNLVEALL